MTALSLRHPPKPCCAAFLLAALGCSGSTAPATGAPIAKIAFYTNRDRNAEVYVMHADGTGPVNLTNNPAFDVNPAWSPDGSKIAFGTNRDGDYEVYVMNADGTGVGKERSTPASADDEEKTAGRWNRALM